MRGLMPVVLPGACLIRKRHAPGWESDVRLFVAAARRALGTGFASVGQLGKIEIARHRERTPDISPVPTSRFQSPQSAKQCTAVAYAWLRFTAQALPLLKSNGARACVAFALFIGCPTTM